MQKKQGSMMRALWPSPNWADPIELFPCIIDPTINDLEIKQKCLTGEKSGTPEVFRRQSGAL
jgi:hypothetical protein